MKILDILSESIRTERLGQHKDANVLRGLYRERDVVTKDLNQARIDGDDDSVAELEAQLADINANIKQMSGVTEAKNHLGDREYQTYGSWKAACKKAYPGCTFRGDKDIGAAVVDGKDVGEWDGAVGSVYAPKPISESTELVAKVKDAIKRGSAKLKEMEADLRDMKNAARTEKEHTAVEEFEQMVSKQRRVVERLRKSLESRETSVTEAVASKWDKYADDELYDIVSDYHKDVHGSRPRHVTDRQSALDTLHSLDQYMAREKSTPAGRQRLRDNGWDIND